MKVKSNSEPELTPPSAHVAALEPAPVIDYRLAVPNPCRSGQILCHNRTVIPSGKFQDWCVFCCWESGDEGKSVVLSFSDERLRLFAEMGGGWIPPSVREVERRRRHNEASEVSEPSRGNADSVEVAADGLPVGKLCSNPGCRKGVGGFPANVRPNQAYCCASCRARASTLRRRAREAEVGIVRPKKPRGRKKIYADDNARWAASHRRRRQRIKAATLEQWLAIIRPYKTLANAKLRSERAGISEADREKLVRALDAVIHSNLTAEGIAAALRSGNPEVPSGALTVKQGSGHPPSTGLESTSETRTQRPRSRRNPRRHGRKAGEQVKSGT